MARSLLYVSTGAEDPPSQHNQLKRGRAVDMRIYDIEFDIDSFLDEMEEMQRARRQRQQQILSESGAGGGSRERDGD
jgi:hypothetical protein